MVAQRETCELNHHDIMSLRAPSYASALDRLGVQISHSPIEGSSRSRAALAKQSVQAVRAQCGTMRYHAMIDCSPPGS